MMVAAYGVAANERTKATPKHSRRPFGTLRGGARHDRLSRSAAGIHGPELVGDVERPRRRCSPTSTWTAQRATSSYRVSPQSLPSDLERTARSTSSKPAKGLKYSNGSPVKACDFEYAIKRGFLATGQGVGFYTDIAGAEAPSRLTRPPAVNISGIIGEQREADDRDPGSSQPRGDFLTILALLFAGAGSRQDGDPRSTTGTIPATGPAPPSRATTRTAASRWLRNKYSADQVHPAREPEPASR